MLPVHIKNYVEGELRAYNANKRALEQLKRERDEIYERTRQPQQGPVQGSHPGDPTASAAIILEKIDTQIAHLEKCIAKINHGLAICTELERKIIEMKYMGAYEPTHEETMDILRIGNRNTYWSAKDRALAKIAKACGVWY